MAIPKKQHSHQSDWAAYLHDAYANPDKDRAAALIDRAADDVRKLRARFGHVALSWSGGKDSQALRLVAEAANVEESLLVISQVEWPAFLEWATDNMPWGLYIEQRPYGIDYIKSHPEMLFPDGPHAAKWFAMIQHRGQRDYMNRTGGKCLLLGRRRSDGNFISRDGTNLYRDRGGWWRASPIADWTHEDVLTVLGAYQTPLPPCYGWPRGFRVGTNAWPIRQWCTSQAKCWDEVAEIDRDVLQLAAAHDLPGAREALNRCAD